MREGSEVKLPTKSKQHSGAASRHEQTPLVKSLAEYACREYVNAG